MKLCVQRAYEQDLHFQSTCVHEIGHAMGFMHEQTSPLRDDHIRVEFDGISPRKSII